MQGKPAIIFKSTLITAVFLLTASYGFAKAKKKEAPPAPPPYERVEALKTIINPHNQISDEGDVLWSRCLICHKNVPDIKKEKSIKDVKLRFGKDYNRVCYSCHKVKRHPGAEGVGPAMSGFVAPKHLLAPTKDVYLNMRLGMKEVSVILPLEPETGKIFCGTCHNPHERGVLYGKANWGADQESLLRSEGLDVCQLCHRK
ncbi:MAG: cytochrome c3 family protein [Thermodesulfobacteriota bacterium]